MKTKVSKDATEHMPANKITFCPKGIVQGHVFRAILTVKIKAKLMYNDLKLAKAR